MAMPWRPLAISSSASAHLPPLLISASFTSNSYTIYVTDLTHIWTEVLDRRAIIRRSLNENTSIDPSEDAEQLKVFLHKIQLGVEAKGGTTLALSVKANGDRATIILSITAKLPKPLESLKWPIYLSPGPQSLLMYHLTIPLLQAQNTRMKEMAGLAEVLRDKDHVIQKLVDKLQAQGTELGHIFPGAAGKGGRKISRALAEERVKGLGAFDMEAWRKAMGSGETEDTMILVRDVFGHESSSVFKIGGSSQVFNVSDIWWENIGGESVALAAGTATISGQRGISLKGTIPLRDGKDEASPQENDDFQVQETPPHLAGKASKIVVPQTDDDSTDVDDLDASSHRFTVPDSFPVSSPAKRPIRLGVVGGKEPTPKSPHIDNNVNDDASTDGEPSSPHKMILPKQAVPPAPEVVKSKKGMVGKIGDKKKEAPLIATPDVESESTISLPDRKSKSRFGVIGHKAVAALEKDGPSVKDGVNHATRGRTETKQEKDKTPPRRETSRERADKKRVQLKRELEEKAKAPVKKKRKF